MKTILHTYDATIKINVLQAHVASVEAHRYGTCGVLSTSAVITLPRVSKLWLMLPASLARLSTAPDRPMFSLPARSTCMYSRQPVSHVPTCTMLGSIHKQHVCIHAMVLTGMQGLVLMQIQLHCTYNVIPLHNGKEIRTCSSS